MRLFRPWFFQKWLFPGAKFRIRAGRGSLFLTFDDGPDPSVTPVIKGILDKYNVKALFFCNGEKAEEHPCIVQSLRDSGHLIGNHGYLHINGWRTGLKEYSRNAERACKFTSCSFFRPPFGKITPSQFRLLKKNYTIFFWDLMPYDFDISLQPSECLRVLLKRIRQGSIIVLHDKGGSSTPLILEDFIKGAMAAGYEFKLPVT